MIRPTLTLSAYHVPPLASYPRQTRPPLVWRRSFVILLTASTIRVADLFESSLRGSPAGPQRPTASAFPTRSSAAAVWTTNPRPPWPRAPHPCHRGTEELEGQGGLPVVVFARALEAPPPSWGFEGGGGGRSSRDLRPAPRHPAKGPRLHIIVTLPYCTAPNRRRPALPASFHREHGNAFAAE